jgi:putative transcriptional regulator
MNYTNYRPPLSEKPVTPVPFRHYQSLQSWLWSTRMIQGLTQQELADFSGVSRNTIHMLETGKRWPSIVVALKLSAALGTPVEQLFTLRQ